MDEFLTFEEQLAWVMQNKEAMGVEAFLKFMMDNREEFSSLQPKKGVPWKDHPLKWLTDNPDALSETTFGKMIDEESRDLLHEFVAHGTGPQAEPHSDVL